MGSYNVVLNVSLTREQLTSLILDSEDCTFKAEGRKSQLSGCYEMSVLPDYGHEDEGGLKITFNTFISRGGHVFRADVELATKDRQNYAGTVTYQFVQDNMSESG